MINVILRKVKGGEAVRTDEVSGACPSKPCIGKGFQMFADPVIKGAICRMIWTSPVREIEENGLKMTVKTENSTYELEFEDAEGGGMFEILPGSLLP